MKTCAAQAPAQKDETVLLVALLFQESLGTRPAAEYLYRSGVSLETAIRTLVWRNQ